MKLAYSANRQNVIEPERQLPITHRTQVLVAGGGTAGTAAAIAAARAGAETMVVERGGFVGGTGTASLMCLYTTPYKTMYGVCRELIDGMAELGGAVKGPVVPFDPEAFKRVAMNKLREAGVKTLLYTWTSDAIVEDGRVCGIVIENKSGRQAILADVVIDASGDGDVAARAGADFVVGREDDGKMRPMTVIFRMGPVDVRKIAAYREQHPKEFSPDPGHNVLDLDDKIVRLDGFFSIMEAGRDKGLIDKNIHYLRLWGIAKDTGNLYVNTARVYGVDGTNAADLSRAHEESMRQIEQLVVYLKENIPGFEKAELLDTAVNIGVRETRRIVGEHILTIEDCANHRKFPDAVVTATTHMVPGVEIHSPDGGEGRRDDAYVAGLELPLSEFSIPFRCFVPKRLDGILVAGRCLSATHEGDAWTRNQPIIMQIGQAAGVAAALASGGNKVPLRELDIAKVQKALLSQGAHIVLPEKESV